MTLSRVDTWSSYSTILISLCIIVGTIWDISWHRTIGRDTFWTYPHLLQQFAAIVAGIGGGWLILRTTFASKTDEWRIPSVKVWGFRGPLGAWVSIWGTTMMITSAPFDNWWHNAYGLDVTILSPPHIVLGIGIACVQIGALILTLAAWNRAGERGNGQLGATYVLAVSVIVCMFATTLLEVVGFANTMHGSFFYKVTACVFPIALVAFARAAHIRWPATTVAAAYMMVVLIPMWTLQLFPATPKLAPIYNPVTHMVPPPFPLLLIVPAFFMDILMRRLGQGRDWGLALLLGVVFVASFASAQWFFADFLLSPSARNIVFAGDRWDYNIPPGAWQHIFWGLDRNAAGDFSPVGFARGLLFAVLFAVVSSRLGLWLGSVMRQVRR